MSLVEAVDGHGSVEATVEDFPDPSGADRRAL